MHQQTTDQPTRDHENTGSPILDGPASCCDVPSRPLRRTWSDASLQLGPNLEVGRRSESFHRLVMENVRYRRLEVLCRYGDYLAERLKVLRDEIKKKSDGKHPLPELWTDTAALLWDEDSKKDKPYHDRIRTAAKDLGWSHEGAVFMARAYGMRNKLMHAEMFELVDERDWTSIANRCAKDLEKLRHLFINSDETSREANRQWEQIIEEFRDRWVCRSGDGSTWTAQPTIQEALDAGLGDRASLCKIAMLPALMSPEERTKFISDRKKNKDIGEKSQKKEKQKADAKLRAAANQPLEKEVSDPKDAVTAGGTQEETLARLGSEDREYSSLQKENTKCHNQIRLLKKQIKEKDGLLEDCRRWSQALPAKLKEYGVSAETVEDIQKAMKDGEAEVRKAREEKKENAEKKRQDKENEMQQKG